jgi:hypothetical protein
MVLRIVVDKDNASIVYVTYGGYASSNVWKTTNAGSAWTDISGVLPSVPVRGFARYPLNANWLYAGTEVGVFASTDGGTNWAAVNDGPANVSVDELFWFDNSTLVAATHGRGMFRTTVTAAPTGIAGVPTSVSATAQPGGIRVSFVAPVNVGAGITGYTATCSAAGQATRSSTGSTSPITVGSLTIGVPYSCTVTANTTYGSSAASAAASATVTVRSIDLTPILMLLLD